MIELKLRKTVVELRFSFFAVVALFLFLKSYLFGIAALAACGIHELAHLAIMTIFGISADRITFYGAGICISSKETEYAKTGARALILLAGALANFAAAAFLHIVGNDAASAVNLLTGILNLLPIGELDGAQLLKLAVIKICRPENVDKTVRLFGIFTLAAVTISITVFAVRFFL